MSEPIWLQKARTLLGTHEGAGTLDNPIIMAWAKELGGWYPAFYKHDSIPWCGLFVGVTMKRGLPNVTLPANSLGALQWGFWGVRLEKPSVGAIMVFQRPGGGHVSYYVGEDADTYHVLGGNQSDTVNVTRIAKARCTTMRWPPGVDLPTSGPVLLAQTGAVSNNEA